MMKLRWPSIPCPTWFRGSNGHHIGIVVDTETVEANGSLMKIHEGAVPSVGTRLVVFPSRDFFRAEIESEYHERREAEQKAAELQRELLRQQEAVERHDRRVRMQENAETENAKLLIPARWTSGRKTVLSGLSENSWGDGRNAKSVVHVLLLEDIEEGRFKREANSFLCTTASNTDGEAWTGSLETYDDGVDGHFVSCVTCRSCLKLAARWTDPQNAVAPEVVPEGSSTPTPTF